MNEDLREFLIESNENLANLDREIIELEKTPKDQSLISAVFRTIHTFKGTCGFFDFACLGSVAHAAENILCQVREEHRPLTPELISLVLEAVDKIKDLLVKIETTGKEGEDDAKALRLRLNEAHRGFVPGASIVLQTATTEHAHLNSATVVAGSAAVQLVQAATYKEQSRISVLVHDSLFRALPFEKLNTDLKASSEATVATGRDVSGWSAGDLRSEDENRGTDKRGNANLAKSSIRVDVGLLNKLMDLVGELALARNQLVQETTSLNPVLLKTAQRLNLITNELQAGVMKTRMQPIGVVWNKLPRVVRDLAAKCSKIVQLEIQGAGTELDKSIIEAIKDPITHIVRNSCDHGIELPEVRVAKGKSPGGLLLLRAYHEGGIVNLEISDDGAGMNCEVLKRKAIEKGLLRAEMAARMSDRDARHLIFIPGFSTAARITSISGRGVGMDVVKTNIEKIGGSVDVMDREPYGTTILIKIPLTPTIISGLVVSLDPDAV